MILSFLLKNWKRIATVVVALVLLEFCYRLFNQIPNKTSSSSSSSSTAIAEQASSSQTISAVASSSFSFQETLGQDDKVTTSVTKERYRPDGTLESREVHKTERESKAQRTTSKEASKSTTVLLTEVTQSTSVASASIVASESFQTVFHDETPQAGIGPIIWVTTDGTFAGLSYRIFELKAVEINGSLVLGTRINSLPDLDVGAGGFVSKTLAPGLELGVVGVVKVPDLEEQLGLGLSYQF